MGSESSGKVGNSRFWKASNQESQPVWQDPILFNQDPNLAYLPFLRVLEFMTTLLINPCFGHHLFLSRSYSIWEHFVFAREVLWLSHWWLLALSIFILFSHCPHSYYFSNIWYIIPAKVFPSTGIPSLPTSGESFNSGTATLCQGFSVFHLPPVMGSSLPARQQVIQLQSLILLPAFLDHSWY